MIQNQDQLLEAATGGDRDALVALLEHCGPLVRARLARKWAQEAPGKLDMDDVMQVTYLEAFLRVGQFESRGEGAFLAWLTQIAENNWRDAVRELGRQKRPPEARRIAPTNLEQSATSLLDQLGWTSTTPSRTVGQREISSTVLAAMERLPLDYARVLQLYDLQGGAVERVASEMGRSTGAIFMLRARALDRLREILSGVLGDFGSFS
ncbi:MAG: sigma-70 family RNA polymerase sigma factor [Phycisphaerae bacterium]|nr:sigma-70 family RNA polymerase sigma factor [Phycisphaerae bacterium]